MGGFLSLAGCLSGRDGLLVAGGITAGAGLVALAPGIYMLVSSGGRTEIRSDRAPLEPSQASRQLGLMGAF